MVKKKYDPLWEIIDEKIALQDQEQDVDLPCPHCHVLLHVGFDARDGQRIMCGLCGGYSEMAKDARGARLEPID